MPSLTLDDNQSAYQIRSYQPGRIQINEQVFTHSVIVMTDKPIVHWEPTSAETITSNAFSSIIEYKPDILLIGTGATHLFLDQAVYGELINLGIGVEMMETRAACRTFNALSAENRNVVAALIV